MANGKSGRRVQLNVSMPREVYEWFSQVVKEKYGYTHGDKPGFAQFFKDWERGLFEIEITSLGEQVLEGSRPSSEKSK